MLADYRAKFRLFSRDVRLLILVQALMGFGYVGLYAVLFNLYLLRLGCDPEFIGRVNAAGRLGFGLAGIPAGLLGVRFGARRLLLAGESLMFIGLVAAPCVELLPEAAHAAWLPAACALSFVGATLFFVNSSPYLMSVTTQVERRHAFSALAAIVPLSAFLGSLTGGLLPGRLAALLAVADAHPAPYRWALVFGGSLFLLTIPLVLATRPPAAPGDLRAATGAHPRPPLFAIAVLSLVSLVASVGFGATGAFFNVYLDDGLGVATRWIGAITAASQLTAVPAAALMPLVAGALGNRRAYAFAILGATVALVPMGLVPHIVAAGAALVLVNACGAVSGTVFNLYSLISVPARWRSLMSGCAFTAMGCSWSLTAFFGGRVIERFGYAALFLGAGAVTALGALVFAVGTGLIETRAARSATPDTSMPEAISSGQPAVETP